MKMRGLHLSAGDAAHALDVSRATLYAYVSRGLIRSESRPGSRERRYLAEDVKALVQRKEARRDPASAAREALHFGTPLLESGLARIDAGRLYYRGRSATELAVTHTLEQVASLLWSGDAAAPFPDALPEPLPAPLWRLVAALPPLEGFQVVLTALGARDACAWDLSPEGVRRTGARILRTLAAVAAGVPPSGRPVTEVLARGWATRARDARSLLETLLILWADHELNVSTFTARCAASALSHPYAALVAALSALRGVRHGGATEQVEALFEQVPAPDAARRVLEARLRRGEGLPGFGHPLYPEGDPRAALLLARVRAARPRSREIALADALLRAAAELTEQLPNIDFGVTVLRRALGLAPSATLALVAIGRSVGWIAHVLEQYADPRLIRPRARYVGVPPAPEEGATR